MCHQFIRDPQRSQLRMLSCSRRPGWWYRPRSSRRGCQGRAEFVSGIPFELKRTKATFGTVLSYMLINSLGFG